MEKKDDKVKTTSVGGEKLNPVSVTIQGVDPRKLSREIRKHGKELIEGVKHDQEKARYDLIPPRSLDALVGIYTYGSVKYGDRNWEKGIGWSRIFAATMRHLWAFWKGEDIDPESGMLHTAHAAWGCFALIEYYFSKKDLDDRPKQ